MNGRERKRVAALLSTSGLVRNRNSVHGRVPCSIWTLRPSWLTETPGRVGGNAPPQISTPVARERKSVHPWHLARNLRRTESVDTGTVDAPPP